MTRSFKDLPNIFDSHISLGFCSNSLSRYLNQYRNNNKISNNVYIQDCENCSIFGGDEKLSIGFGVKDLVVVDAGDVILVMDKDKDQEIKHLLNDINDSPEFGAFI